MLERLDDIDWAARTHAFGSASDVPTMLRHVATGGETGRAALGELWGAICHQGTVYDASAPAVPFLVELALSDDVDTESRLGVLALVFAIGRGKGYWQVHRESAAALGRLPADVDDRLTAEARWVAAARRAAEQGASACLEAIDAFPARLWLPVATMAVVAGEKGRSSIPRLLTRADALPPFAAAGLYALAELVTTGRLQDGGAAVAALDGDLADYRRQSAGDVVTLESYFVDTLVERLCVMNDG